MKYMQKSNETVRNGCRSVTTEGFGWPNEFSLNSYNIEFPKILR